MTIAFVGLGQMGKPTAKNPLRQVKGLLVHAADTASCAERRDAGANPTDACQWLSVWV